MSYAFRCEVCDGPSRWRMDRHGDAVVTWACGFHVNAVLERLQRAGEVTQVTVRRRAEQA